MADKKPVSKAEQAVSGAKRTSGKSAGKNSKAKAAPKRAPKVITEFERSGPPDYVVGIVFIGVFLVLAFACVQPEGALVKVLRNVLMGLLGVGGFYFAIPATLYLAVIRLFGRKSRMTMRSACTVSFAFLCGCVYHLAVKNPQGATGISIINMLYQGGIDGTTGGVFCGGVAMILDWACGNVLALLLCVFIAVVVLLGAMEITIPSIIRAIANRPRDEYEEPEEDHVEPATIVVNHIANKQIQRKRQNRERAQAMKAQAEFLPAGEDPLALEPSQGEPKTLPGKGSSFMSRVDEDINAPLLPEEAEVDMDIEPVLPRKKRAEPPLEPVIPSRMPELTREEAIAPAPKMEKTKKREKEQIPQVEAPKLENPKAKVTAKEATDCAQQVAQEIAQSQETPKADYCYPPIDLLRPPVRGGADGTEEMRENSRRLNETLASFNIDAHIINVTRGPSVTRYEVELDKGVRLNKLTGCADDIALSLGASGVRIAAVPGKISVVGIEVPNRMVTTVSLREVIGSGEFEKAKSKTSVALGKSIDGNCVVGNIAKMPHLLIAGTTGSGKSVCMNSIIISLLYKASPEDVKLIMVDPKMVELGIYNGIPHLLIPVVTDPKKAAGSLQWAVVEMLRRYRMMSDLGVRDLESYNSIIQQEEDGQKLPQVVIIIDELADLMMVAAKEVEDSICRIAQMGRAAGMHLIIATQRPSANVITGLMKANIPSRIAFSVASAMESRIILDTMGAEKLVGKGDMLYAPHGSGKPLRVQGCFVTDSEVEAVTAYVKENSISDYDQQVLEEIEKKAVQTGKKVTAADVDANDEELEGDEMLPQAVDVILETGQASVSMLQRRLKLGYARAARIVDEMEEKGIVGPFQGSKPREIRITKEQWEARKNGQSQQMDFLEEDFSVPEEID